MESRISHRKGFLGRGILFPELCEVGAEKEDEYRGRRLEHRLLAILGYGLFSVVCVSLKSQFEI